jgi:hypothetical protein
MHADVAGHRLRRHGHSACRGQALAEMGFVVVLLTFLVMGIVEVGFAFLRTSMIVHAARDGARFGATLDTSLRDPATGCFTPGTGGGKETIESHVDSVLSSIGFDGTVGVMQECDDDLIPTVTVTVTGPLELIFNLIGTTFDVNRSVTFQDENRICPSACA